MMIIKGAGDDDDNSHDSGDSDDGSCSDGDDEKIRNQFNRSWKAHFASMAANRV